jgi:hypothetical protein
MRAAVEIGKRYTGQHIVHRNQATGDYSECRPTIEGHMLVIQKCLDAHAKREAEKARKAAAKEKLEQL